MPKKIPVRRCVACREMREKKQLLRIVKTPQGEIVFDQSGKTAGRGAYICRSRSCFERAVKVRAIERALNGQLSQQTVDMLRTVIECGEGENGQ